MEPEYFVSQMQKFKTRLNLKILKMCYYKASSDRKMKICIEQISKEGYAFIGTIVVHSLSGGKIVKMVLNLNPHNSYNEDGIFKTAGKVPIVDTVKIDNEVIGGIEICSFIT